MRYRRYVTVRSLIDDPPPGAGQAIPASMAYARLRGLVAEAGSQKKLAARLGITQGYLSQVLHGRVAMPDYLLRELRLTARIVYFHEERNVKQTS